MSIENESTGSEYKATTSKWTRRDPKFLAQGFLKNFDSWRSSRSWGIVAAGIFPLLLLLIVFGLVFWGSTFAAGDLINSYVKAAEAAAPVKENGAGADEELADVNDSGKSANDQKAIERKELSEYAFKLYQRVLDKDPDNKRAKYYVASQLAQRGDLTNARMMMDSLAPKDNEGYPAAHAWKAYDALRNVSLTQRPVNQKQLEHDLEIAAKWGGTHPQLLVQRGRMLEAEGKVNQALHMYSVAADRDPNFRLLLADAYRRHGQPSRTQQAVESSINYFSRNLNTPAEETQDRMKVAQAYLFNNDVPKAVSILEEGVVRRDDKDEYRRAISQVLRTAYLSSIQLNQSDFKANLMLLDRAIEADPVNPGLQADVAKLTELLLRGGKMEDNIKTLNEHLANGAAPLLSHLLLANLHYFNKSIENANLHWELVLKINPSVVIALRSYGLSLAAQSQPDFARAMEMIDKAIALSDGAVDMLDAKGDILNLMDRRDEAVEIYRTAVQKSPFVTVPIRKKLVVLYGQLNRSDEADREMKIVEIIEKRLEELKARRESASKESATTEKSIVDDLPIEKEVEKAANDQAAEGNNKVEDESLDALIKGLQEIKPADAKK
jgi:lipopolysaccharide biosynthesis regulator YciM